MFKRSFDLVFGVLALIPAIPLIVLSTLLVYFEDGMPVIFYQVRVGKNECQFKMFKIRTMVKDAKHLPDPVVAHEAGRGAVPKRRHDPRLTRAGRFLRRFSLDELPQLFNVIEGTMSLVGPRPELPELVETYEPWQRKRFDVLPGLTGWWQINHRGDQPMSLHVEDDLYYIENYSPWLDIQILLRTVWVVLTGRGAY
jgi:lipopolysaccharide/colanic/teichoic acid biosynthesis glycosyltransferase